jgi:hypothetical protein
MSRLSRESSEETADANFRRILAEVRRAGASPERPPREDDECANFSPSLSAEALFSIDDSQAAATGGAAHWAAAFGWLEDQEAPEAAIVVEPQQPRAESPQAISDELGLNENLTQDELNRLRRLYMWRNHPDRHSEAQRENATRRVAIANMLLDQAQARLTRDRRS